MTRMRTVIADDHDVVRRGLAFLLTQSGRADVVGEAKDGLDLLRLVEQHNPDLVITDIGMPLMNGIDAAAHLSKHSPKTTVAVVTVFSDEDTVIRAINAGVKAFLLKESVERDLEPALDAIQKGRNFFSSAISEQLLDQYVQDLRGKGLSDSYQLLTLREKQVLQLLAEGKTTKEAAEILFVSPATLETHRTHIMEKLKLRNVAELVLFAARRKIVS
jgi:DNA-binding NarL/FixJ family response regulator